MSRMPALIDECLRSLTGDPNRDELLVAIVRLAVVGAQATLPFIDVLHPQTLVGNCLMMPSDSVSAMSMA